MSVYSMQQHTYMYTMPQAAGAAPRQYSSHGTSSAFSSSALPDEDWTKISDLAERRRIQNRIAQRNYRKKLKRRLEDLERRAGSSDEAEGEKPETQTTPASSTTRSTSPTSKVTKRTSASKSPKATKPAAIPIPVKPVTQQFTPPLEASDKLSMARSFENQERDLSPPMFSAYGTYPAPDDLILQPYAAAQPYPTMTTADPYPSYLASTSLSTGVTSLPQFTDPFIKRESYSSAGEDTMGNLFNNYSFASAMDMNSYCTSPTTAAPNTPPLSHSYGQSTTCSETGFEYPTTPLSMPDSPGMVGQFCQ